MMILDDMTACTLFLCKQKTAYEMRISDWSSDVCSSDLRTAARSLQRHAHLLPRSVVGRRRGTLSDGRRLRGWPVADRWIRHLSGCGNRPFSRGSGQGCHPAERSEEHTSELQSLMRISYAVFCL